MMVQRGHFEYALFSQLIGANLQYAGNAAGHEAAAHYGKQQHAAAEYGHCGYCAAKRHGTGIAHKHAGGVSVVSQESKAAARYGGREYGH
jgi:hypothetical protein